MYCLKQEKSVFIFPKTCIYTTYCCVICYFYIVYMRKELTSLKDFEVTSNENVIERGQKFQSCIDQMAQFGCKSYWVMARTGVGAKMQIDGYDGEVSAYISNDYSGMSQRTETKEAGMNAVRKHGSSATCVGWKKNKDLCACRV